MFSFLYQIIRRLVTYLLPFVLLYILTRRMEKRVPLRFSRYFLLSALLLILGGIIHWTVYYPTPAYTHMLYIAGVITTISVLIMFFCDESKCGVWQKQHTARYTGDPDYNVVLNFRFLFGIFSEERHEHRLDSLFLFNGYVVPCKHADNASLR